MINKETVERIAALSKINISKEETEYFSSQLSQIFEMIDSLKDLDLTNVEPLASVREDSLRTRKDVVNDASNQDDLFANTDHGKDVHCFVVPKVIE